MKLLVLALCVCAATAAYNPFEYKSAYKGSKQVVAPARFAAQTNNAAFQYRPTTTNTYQPIRPVYKTATYQPPSAVANAAVYQPTESDFTRNAAYKPVQSAVASAAVYEPVQSGFSKTAAYQPPRSAVASAATYETPQPAVVKTVAYEPVQSAVAKTVANEPVQSAIASATAYEPAQPAIKTAAYPSAQAVATAANTGAYQTSQSLVKNVPNSNDVNAQIISSESEINADGYKYSYRTSNGIGVREYGQLRNVNNEYVLGVQGEFEYTGDDGKLIAVKYTADENGFHPESDVLPVPPAIPEAILRSLEYIRTHPQKLETVGNY